MSSVNSKRAEEEKAKGYNAAEDVIVQHACMAGGATLIVGFFPATTGLDIVAMIPILYAMYIRINKVMNVAFSKHKVQSIAKMVGANIIGNLASILVAKVVFGIIRYVPAINILGGLGDASVNAIVMYIAGRVYQQIIQNLSQSGRKISEEELDQEMKAILNDKDKLKEFAKDGKAKMKGKNFADYKDDAQKAKDAYENDSELEH